MDTDGYGVSPTYRHPSSTPVSGVSAGEYGYGHSSGVAPGDGQGQGVYAYKSLDDEQRQLEMQVQQQYQQQQLQQQQLQEHHQQQLQRLQLPHPSSTQHTQHTRPRPLRLQLPQYLYTSAPTLVPGGGAEVVPLTSTEWFVNSGFTGGFSFVDGFQGTGEGEGLGRGSGEGRGSGGARTAEEDGGGGGDGFLGQPHASSSSSATSTTNSNSTAAAAAAELDGQGLLRHDHDGSILGMGKGKGTLSSAVNWSSSSPFDFADDDALGDDNQQRVDAFPAMPSSSSSNFGLPMPLLGPSILNNSVGLPPLFNLPPPAPPTNPSHLALAPTPSAPYGLPVYSVSGFDILALLSRVHHRPHATVHLGPVDLTCSFVVVDPRRFDAPIVYCSPTFCVLTGYSESEVLGRNCRFLQAPPPPRAPPVVKGGKREWTSGEMVERMRGAVAKGEDVQVSVVNYKKGGEAFMNLVTIITVFDEGAVVKTEGKEKEREPLWHVGFQVDLTEQPTAIMERLREGTYTTHYEPPPPPPLLPTHNIGLEGDGNETLVMGARRTAGALLPHVTTTGGALQKQVYMSKHLKRLLVKPGFVKPFPLSVVDGSAAPSAASVAGAGAGANRIRSLSLSATALEDTSPSTHTQSQTQNHPLHLFLLSNTPDFIHVVSLKGAFLYVSPSVKRVLGYDARELVGRGLVDVAYAPDVVPLMRELKESSAVGGGGVTGSDAAATAPALSASASASASAAANVGAPTQTHTHPAPRAVDLLFRALTKSGRVVWLECRGRLHVEPGKGRKAIVLTGRAREMMRVRWEDVCAAGGVAKGVRELGGQKEQREQQGEQQQADAMEGEGEENTKAKNPLPHHEIWGLLGGTSAQTTTFLSAGAGAGLVDVLGWSVDEVVGRGVGEFVCNSGGGEQGVGGAGDAVAQIGEIVSGMRVYQRALRRVLDREAAAAAAASAAAGARKGKGKAKRGAAAVTVAAKAKDKEKKRAKARAREHLPGISARWRKVRCAMRARDGRFVDVWFVIYRADVEDVEDVEGADAGGQDAGADTSSSSAPGKRSRHRSDNEEEEGREDGDEDIEEEAELDKEIDVDRDDDEGRGCSIAPAALVYQIRRADAPTMACAPGEAPTEAALLGGTATAGGVGWSSSRTASTAPSGTGSATPVPVPKQLFAMRAALMNASTSSSSVSSASSLFPVQPQPPTPSHPQPQPQPEPQPSTAPAPSTDMFSQLATARGTSWQYELQQLRFANARLEEEVGVLEGKVRAGGIAMAGGSGGSGGESGSGGAEGGNGVDDGREGEEGRLRLDSGLDVGLDMDMGVDMGEGLDMGLGLGGYNDVGRYQRQQTQQSQQSQSTFQTQTQTKQPQDLFSRGELVVSAQRHGRHSQHSQQPHRRHQQQSQHPHHQQHPQHNQQHNPPELARDRELGSAYAIPPAPSQTGNIVQGSLYDALPPSSRSHAHAHAGLNSHSNSEGTLHHPKPLYSSAGAGRAALPLSLPPPVQPRDRERDGLSSALGYPAPSPYAAPRPPVSNSHSHPYSQSQSQSHPYSYSQSYQQQEGYTLPSRPRTQSQPQPPHQMQTQTQTWGTGTMPPLHVPVSSMPPPSVMYHPHHPSSSSTSASLLSRHRSHSRSMRDVADDGDVDRDVKIDMGEDAIEHDAGAGGIEDAGGRMDVQSMYAAAAAAAAGGGSGPGPGLSLKRPWSAVGS